MISRMFVVFVVLMIFQQSLKAQPCDGFISFKVDQYYTNIRSKPDSLDKVDCNFIANRLGEKEAYIDFFDPYGAGGSTYLVFIIRKNQSPVIIELPKIITKQDVHKAGKQSEIERGVIVLQKNRSAIGGYYEYDHFFRFIEPYLAGCETIYYSSTDDLNLVNIRHCKTKDATPLHKKYLMIRLHTGASFLQNRQRLKLNEEMKILMLGNVDYDCNTTQSGAAEKLWTALPGTKKELTTIGSLIDKKNKIEILDSCNATEQNFSDKINAASFDIVHIATHGFYFTESVMTLAVRNDTYVMQRSGFVLSGANQPKATVEPFNDKGLFTAMDFLQLNFKNAGLFILSTCHSGEGDKLNSGPPIGLTLALMRASSNAMILSNRAVPDDETAVFMSTLYKFINKNRDIDICFRDALKDLTERYPNKDWSFFDLVH